jgi:hypothetical protein
MATLIKLIKGAVWPENKNNRSPSWLRCIKKCAAFAMHYPPPKANNPVQVRQTEKLA